MKAVIDRRIMVRLIHSLVGSVNSSIVYRRYQPLMAQCWRMPVLFLFDNLVK